MSLDKKRYLTTNKMLNVLIFSASAFIVTISSISNTIPNDMEFKKNLKNHIMLILKDNDSIKSVLLVTLFESIYCKLNTFFFHSLNSALLPNVVDQAVKDSNEYLASKERPPLSQDVVNLIENQILSIKEPDHKIRSLVGNVIIICLTIVIMVSFCLIIISDKRIKEFIAAVISSNNARPQQCPLGLSAFKDELAAVTGNFLRLITYNRKVFSTFYDDILKNIFNQCSSF